MRAEEIVAALSMQPHPEGGWYTQTFHDVAGGERGHSTAIYYLLEAGQKSAWHRVTDAVEIWHYYAGAPLTLERSSDGLIVETVVLGPDILSGERPQAIVPAGWWQAAHSNGAFTLVGCTVSPGFDFSVFELAPPGWMPGLP
ncbi:MAG: cupin [Rhizobiales bacterium 63-7]|uniref:cupin domain-containing protein n=1 Tax=Rhizobium sp. YJ-22 TaxID=3037556 RepID=UPI000925D407|nr:cupin domain-containing protein [Rhizobium sp. YJ-22]MBN9029219.1 cupin domain-containing protein [Hyphomicrobiales bacterium]MDG3577355.1 cupin domain-containing protein [Rhizobium sp. YJ-22]OJU71789.1 MAG: cupin [Rhizobiales bacterium 63-7]